MLKFCVFAFLASAVYGSNFVFLELVENINKNLDYLEKSQNLSRNTTFILTWGVGELYILQDTVPNLDASKLEDIKKLIKRFDVYVQKTLAENPNDLEVQLLYHPERFGASGDFSFQKGRIPEGDPLDESLQEVYEKSIPTDVDIKCANDLLKINKGSDVPRQCETSCDEIMNDYNVTSGIAVDQRIDFIAFEAILNCTNQSPKEILETANVFCNYTKQQLNTMYERRYEAQFESLRYFFLNKILLCGTFGFPEFYSDEFIAEVIGAINNDGSVGTKDNSGEDKMVLAAQTAGILSSVIRLVEEEGKGAKKI